MSLQYRKFRLAKPASGVQHRAIVLFNSGISEKQISGKSFHEIGGFGHRQSLADISVLEADLQQGEAVQLLFTVLGLLHGMKYHEFLSIPPADHVPY